MLIDTPTLSPFSTLPLARSIGANKIGDKGTTELAAILKDTKITNLECAAARAFALVSTPLPLTRACSLTAPHTPLSLQSRV